MSKPLLAIAKKCQKIAIKTFPAVRYPTRKLELAPNTPQLIVGHALICAAKEKKK